MNDEMSAEAKERHFARPRQYSSEQEQWISTLMQVACDTPRDRLTTEAFRNLLLQVGLTRPRLIEWSNRMGSVEPKERSERVKGFQELFRTVGVFGTDHLVVTSLRKLSTLCGITPQEIKAAGAPSKLKG